jgi:uncharacterized membrane protein YeaQ/YmgE (transglycosylase-associated protein family)
MMLFGYYISVGNMLIWLLFGAVVGMVVHLLDHQKIKGGIISTTLVGIGGAFLGGLISLAIFSNSIVGINLPSITIALLAGVVLVMATRFFSQRKSGQ